MQGFLVGIVIEENVVLLSDVIITDSEEMFQAGGST